MASNLHALLGRANPAAATPATIYTSPTSPATKTMLSSLIICNTTKAGSGADDSVRVWIVPNGGAAGDSNAIIMDMVIDWGDPYIMNAVPILEAGDFIVVQSTNGTCTFTASGMKIVAGA